MADFNSVPYSMSRSSLDGREVPEVSLKILVEFVDELAPHWEFIGYALGLAVVVQQLKARNTRVDSLCMDMFAEWIDRGEEVSWDKLLHVLHSQKHRSCAENIKKRLTSNTVFDPKAYSSQHGMLSSHLQTKVEDCEEEVEARKQHEQELMEQIKTPRRKDDGEIRTQVAHDVIRSHYGILMKRLPGRDLIPRMFSQKLISEYEKQVIDAEPTIYKRNEQILSALERRSGKQFEVFLKSLQRLGVSDLVTSLTDAYHQGIIKAGGTIPDKRSLLREDKEDHNSSLVNSYQEAVKKHGCVSIRVIRALLVGPSGVGKSSLRHVLVHGESKEIKTSTPAMETPDVLVVGENYAVEGKGFIWKLVTIECLTESVHACARQHQYKEGSCFPTSVGKLDAQVPLEASSEADSVPKGMSKTRRQSNTESRDVDHKDPLEVAYRQLLKSGAVSEDRIQLQEMTFIHVIDSGGQPAFQDVLPLLLAIPCTYLLVFNASIPLTERITSTWRTKDGEQRLLNDPCSDTHWEFMQRSLSTMQTMSDKFTVGESDTSIFQGAQSKFRFMLVGTFKDECVASQESNELLAAVNSRIATLKERPYFDFFECPKQSQFFFVDNHITLHKNTSEKDIANDREHLNELRQCIVDENCALNLDVPVAWYYLQLITNTVEKKIWTESTLKEFCLKHHYIDEDQADKQFLCLLKLLHVLGFYAYFDLDPEYLKDGVNYVCTDATALYKEVSKLLAIQFYLNLPGVAKRFQGDGIIRHPYDKLFKKVNISSEIEPTWFLEVLHHLGIAARLSPASPHTCSYFIPSCLPHGGANAQEICSVEPLCFTFVYKKDSFTTYCDLPRGIFCRLAVELADSKVQENVQMMVIANESKRTSIKYGVPFLSNLEIDTFMYLTEKPGYLRCQLIIPESTHQGSLSDGAVLQNLHDHCRTIREHLQTALECIAEGIFGRNYCKTASIEAVSSCPCRPDDCFVAPISPSGIAKCPYCRKSKKLSPQERVWFSHLNPTEAEVSLMEENGELFLKLSESMGRSGTSSVSTPMNTGMDESCKGSPKPIQFRYEEDSERIPSSMAPVKTPEHQYPTLKSTRGCGTLLHQELTDVMIKLRETEEERDTLKCANVDLNKKMKEQCLQMRTALEESERRSEQIQQQLTDIMVKLRETEKERDALKCANVDLDKKMERSALVVGLKEAPNPKTIKAFLEFYKERLLAGFDINGIKEQLFNGRILPGPLRTRINEAEDLYGANTLFVEHALKSYDFPACITLCETMKCTNGYPRMNRLGDEMMQELKSNEVEYKANDL